MEGWSWINSHWLNCSCQPENNWIISVDWVKDFLCLPTPWCCLSFICLMFSMYCIGMMVGQKRSVWIWFGCVDSVKSFIQFNDAVGCILVFHHEFLVKSWGYFICLLFSNFCCCSESASITAELLKIVDRIGVFDWTDGVPPFLILDGNASRFDILATVPAIHQHNCNEMERLHQWGAISYW